MLTTLSGEELAKLREELQDIKEPFSLMEFDDEVEDDMKGKKYNGYKVKVKIYNILKGTYCALFRNLDFVFGVC